MLRAAYLGAAALIAVIAQPAFARWSPKLSDKWQWQLQGTVNTGYNVDVYDIDLVDTPVSTIRQLQAHSIHVVCYFSAGSAESFRADYSRFKPSDLGRPLDGWPGERWVDTRSANVRAIMKSRLDAAVAKGCDGVEPDNVDGYSNPSGLPLNKDTQLDYNRFLATEAHARNLTVGLKNDVGQLAALETAFDFAINEQCHQYDECGDYSFFISAGKPVFNAEYAQRYRLNTNGARTSLCAIAKTEKLRTLVLPLALNDGYRFSCD